MKRKTPLRAKPRGKGNRGELAVRDLLRYYGWTSARRNFQSGGQGGGDLIEGPADVHWEVKWHERCCLREWLRQCEGDARPTDIPVVALRDNSHGWMAVLPTDEWFALKRLSPIPLIAGLATPRQKRLEFWKRIDEAEEYAAKCGPAYMGVLEFGWTDSQWYAAVPLRLLLELLKLREA